jgi:hypothetical protein
MLSAEASTHRPMALIVAIMQEFVLFQSSAGILTKQVLLNMHDIIQRLISANCITVEKNDEEHV